VGTAVPLLADYVCTPRPYCENLVPVPQDVLKLWDYQRID